MVAISESVFPIRRALISVSDKRGLVEFAEGLLDLGVELIASTGTALYLNEHGIKAQDISEYTGYPELIGGRVKTLHPLIYSGILFQRDNQAHRNDIDKYSIKPIDLVVVNLYPFEDEVTLSASMRDAMKLVDIGGEALIRAAAKNHQWVAVVVNPDDYDLILTTLQRDGQIGQSLARLLAKDAIDHVVRYNSRISDYFHGREIVNLRYGENPHQSAQLLSNAYDWNQFQGSPIAYNNILDLDTAFRCAHSFHKPTAVIIKHTTPCGIASDKDIETAFARAYAADDKSAFGGVIGVNEPVTTELAEAIVEHFFDALIAPFYNTKALEILAQKPKLKIIEFSESPRLKQESRTTIFGTVSQDTLDTIRYELDIDCELPPNWQDLKFAWKVVHWLKSNAIALVKDECTVGLGSGETARVDAMQLAIQKAGTKAKGAVCASDGFLPFTDNIEIAAEAGITAIIQPGGSKKDKEVLEAAEQHGIIMIRSGQRAFRH